MRCPSAEEWSLLSMNLLSESETATLLSHAEGCDKCRVALGLARRDHAGLLRAFEVFDRHHEESKSELLAALPADTARPRLRLARRWQGLGDMIMRTDTRSRRVAFMLVPAACILIAVVIFLSPGESGVAFASVQKQMRLARTMVCQCTSVTTIETPEGETEEVRTQGTLSMYSDGVTRAWRRDSIEPQSTQWTFPDRYVHIDADGKRTVVRFTDDPNGGGALEGPEQWLGRLLDLTEDPDRELGRDTIGGRDVVGFEIAGWKLGFGARPTPGTESAGESSSAVRLWVDVETRLPLTLQVEQVTRGVLSSTRITNWEQIEWDVPLDPQEFSPPPPTEDEPAEEVELSMPAPTEAAFIEGLRIYAKQSERLQAMLTDRLAELGGDPEAREKVETTRRLLHLDSVYPESLDLDTLAVATIRESSLARASELSAKARGDSEAAASAAEEGPRAAREMAEAIGPVAWFYRRLLLEDREPEYFGRTVKLSDSDKVLVRWKLDDEHMRVIYGDLRAETLPIED